MTATEAPSRAVGQPLTRKEDPHLITGQTTWTDNLQLPGMLHLAILRSPMAHARIRQIDVSPALQRPGVVAAFGAAEIGAELGSLPCVWPVTDDIVIPPHPPLAGDEVRYVGDAVAVVAATDRYLAADALEAIEVDYEPLPVVLDMEAALAEGAPLVHSEAGTNKCYTWPLECGDYAAEAARADVVVKRRYIQQRLIPTPMEPRAVVCSPVSATGDITLWSATQIPHVVRVLLALTTGVPESKIRVIAPDVGGGFGSKLQFYAEEVIATILAKRLGRPVKWTESRTENFQATHHGRDQIQDIEICATQDGKVLGLKVDLTANMGAYLQIITPGIPLLGAFMYPGIYKFDAYSFRCTGVFTNTTPTDAYRGAGRPEATFAIERVMDDLAVELGMEPMELRRRNWIRHEEFPFTAISGLTYDSGNYEAATDRAMEMFGYEALRREQSERRERNDPVQLGIGISTYTEMCGLAPSRVLASLKYVAGGWESATVRVLPTGKVEVVTGTSPHGQGHATAWSQIAADALGVPFEDIEVIHGDTRMAPLGMDTYGSRSLVIGGIAVLTAAQRVVEKAKAIAAHMLEADPRDIEFSAGTFGVTGTPGATKTMAEVAFEAFTSHDLPDGVEPTLVADSHIDPQNFSYPHGTHLCAADVDTETGMVTIRKYVAVDDVGNVVNPLIVDGQVHGGIAQGIAQALYEEAVYDRDGNLVTGTIADYMVPAAPDLPPFDVDRTVTPATSNPLGVKGVGETGTIASTPAVVNAVVDAIRHLGVTDVPMPCSPQNVWRALEAARSSQGAGSQPDARSGPESGGVS
jgi:aerobic carbon-monoxide dehydrogenase large subunit